MSLVAPSAMCPGPYGDHRHADAALVEVAFVTPVGAVAVEKVRVGTALHVGAVVAGEEKDRVLQKPLFTEFGDQLSDIEIQPGNHRGEGRPGMLLRAVSAAAERGTRVDAPVGVSSPASAEALHDAVLGDDQLGMREGRGVEEQEGGPSPRPPRRGTPAPCGESDPGHRSLRRRVWPRCCPRAPRGGRSPTDGRGSSCGPAAGSCNRRTGPRPAAAGRLSSR